MITATQAPSALPTLFVPHGAGPCFFMDWTPAHTWTAMAAFLRDIAASLPRPPRAILLVSAHWLAPRFSVTTAAQPGLIYDYHGFPAHTYELTYPAPGSPALAARVTHLLEASGLRTAEDAERGFDHGVFIPLKVMFPAADIPVVQLSLRSDLDPQAHLQAGQALAPLRDEGVLIVGSGMSFHNMQGYGDPSFTAVSEAFDDWLTATLQSPARQRSEQLENWAQAPAARLSHPAGAEEHLLPLLVVAGAAGDTPGVKAFSDQVLETRISAFRFD